MSRYYEDRLRQIAFQVEGLASSFRQRTDGGHTFEHGELLSMLTILDALAVYARSNVPEPQSFRVYDGLRVVR